MAGIRGRGRKDAKAGEPNDRGTLWARSRVAARSDWAAVDRRLVMAAIDSATSGGAALMFGSAQGGRGMVLTVFIDGDRHKEYASTADEFTELLTGILEAFPGGSVDIPALHGYVPSEAGE